METSLPATYDAIRQLARVRANELRNEAMNAAAHSVATAVRAFVRTLKQPRLHARIGHA